MAAYSISLFNSLAAGFCELPRPPGINREGCLKLKKAQDMSRELVEEGLAPPADRRQVVAR